MRLRQPVLNTSNKTWVTSHSTLSPPNIRHHNSSRRLQLVVEKYRHLNLGEQGGPLSFSVNPVPWNGDSGTRAWQFDTTNPDFMLTCPLNLASAVCHYYLMILTPMCQNSSSLSVMYGGSTLNTKFKLTWTLSWTQRSSIRAEIVTGNRQFRRNKNCRYLLIVWRF